MICKSLNICNKGYLVSIVGFFLSTKESCSLFCVDRTYLNQYMSRLQYFTLYSLDFTYVFEIFLLIYGEKRSYGNLLPLTVNGDVPDRLIKKTTESISALIFVTRSRPKSVGDVKKSIKINCEWCSP